MKPVEPKQRIRKDREATMRLGAVEVVKRGAARYDFSDPYHIAIELSWKEFALAFVGLELGINIAFALLYLASPGCIANARPSNACPGSLAWEPTKTEAAQCWAAKLAGLDGFILVTPELLPGTSTSRSHR